MDGVQRFILNIYGSLLLIALFIALSGCANRDVARKDYARGDYNASYRIWKKWVEKGYYRYNSELLKILDKKRNVTSQEIEKVALDAYHAGDKKSAFLLEGLSLHQGDLQDAFMWMCRGDLRLSSLEDFRNHLFIIEHDTLSTAQQKEYLKQLEAIANNNNADAGVALADFYARKENPFYDAKRADYFYQIAYKLGNQKAGIALAKRYLSTKREEEGLEILQLLSQEGNGRASYEIGNVMLHKVAMILAKQQHSCIATSFTLPHEFYLNKIYATKSRGIYLRERVMPWYKKAYQQNAIEGMLKLIALDIEADNFRTTATLSQMHLQEAESFLQKHQEHPKAPLLLANLYQHYPRLRKSDVVASLYLKSMKKNTTSALWHLYKLYRESNATAPQAEAYLQELLLEGFQPAEVEYNYRKLLQSPQSHANLQLLQNEADAGNVDAIKSMLSLYNRGILPKSDSFAYLEKVCQSEPNNPSIDMKIADYYIQKGRMRKGATILQYYAQLGDKDAAYKLSQLYAKLERKRREGYWLEVARKNGNTKAELAYDSMVLKGMIEGDVATSLERLKHLAKEGNMVAIRLMADAYATGSGVDFNPKLAKSYYLLLLEKGDAKAYLDILHLYKKINIDGRYDQSIEQLYQSAIKNDVAGAKLHYAQFLLSRERVREAKKLLLTLSQEPLARALLYKIRAKSYSLHASTLSNSGTLFMQYASKNAKYSPRKALLYAFRAYLCNTPSTGVLTYELMRSINNSRVIANIYHKAKSYPQCTNP